MSHEDLYELYASLLRSPKPNDLTFRGDQSFLSNMYPTKIRIGKALYDSAEGAFQAGKLRLPGVDYETRARLLPRFMHANPYDARRLGRYELELTPQQLDIWNSGEDAFMDPNAGKFGRMYQVLTSKFDNPELAAMLRGTGDAYLREGTNIAPWGAGSNALGRMLMVLRSQLPEDRLNIVQGDLMDAAEPLIMHQVNNQGFMGKGIAAQIKPDLDFGAYQDFVRSEPEGGLGQVLALPSVAHAGRTYLNVFGQDGLGYDRRYTDYDALASAFQSIAKDYAGQSVAMPAYMGSGLGGGDWNVVKELVNKYLTPHMNVTAYKLK